MSGLGIGDRDRVIVYDSRGVVSGRACVDLPRLRPRRGRRLDGASRGGAPRGARPRRDAGAEGAPLQGRLRRSLVRDLASMRRNVKGRKEQVLDARTSGRFAGTEPEPRAGLRAGHIPGA